MVVGMNPDVVRAIPDLEKRGLLPREKTRRLLRVTRGELVSIHQELRALLYLGVLLLVSGVGLLLKENLERIESIGPVTLALVIALAAAAAFFWVLQTAPTFSWQETPSPHLAFDYVLLLGVLLTAADLAYVETQFTPLGANWPWHLLLVSLFMTALALRFDSRVVFSLALSTFASWRGVSASLVTDSLWRDPGVAVRANALGCGVLFVLLGALLLQADRKAHFEPVAAHLGWLLILGALASGALDSGGRALLYAVGLLACASGLAAYAFYHRRFPLFALGVVGMYIGVSRLVTEGLDSWVLDAAWFMVSSLLVIFGLMRAHRILREVT